MGIRTFAGLASVLLLGACVAYNNGKPVKINSTELQTIRSEANRQIAAWNRLVAQSVSCDAGLQTHVVKVAGAHHGKLRGYVEELDQALARRQIVPSKVNQLREHIEADQKFAGEVQGMLRAECSA